MASNPTLVLTETNSPEYRELIVSRDIAASIVFTFFVDNVNNYLQDIDRTAKARMIRGISLYKWRYPYWKIENTLRGKCISFVNSLREANAQSSDPCKDSPPADPSSLVSIERVKLFFNTHCVLILARLPQSQIIERLDIQRPQGPNSEATFIQNIAFFSKDLYYKI